MLNLNVSSAFKKDRRRCIKRGYDMGLLSAVINTLIIPAPLPPINKDHGLSGNWVSFQECHIQSDWLVDLPCRWQRFVPCQNWHPC